MIDYELLSIIVWRVLLLLAQETLIGTLTKVVSKLKVINRNLTASM